ncbi:hypothetical protein SMACR_00264 [Sordaria macrospora]|uniref:WGS project CABT00000000 data, contig 2.1 n=2 Tax=Sordaria macrospora TaxID=5147 RepID=F7VKM0_SORMK|nr:uncharacterized protein SMAC_00264 [Sordaria macrospora k-hell]KAA8636836.1 hypothetical protein SMACR_00264 [Sordaria macrospora]KAH7634185.1 hypothetical protein B0T09DRAFT_797 [Sordaria sp. MPI-SDFR-AT-0083]WPJ59008.1 hypothetical protein SMAC4_00264 [Sordaria macrospora]CCC06047.1 unnamed protein product [Sordaria macrospora k-hell]
MFISPQESHLISVCAGQGDLAGLAVAVKSLAQREKVTEAEILISSKDDFQRTAAHIAAQLGKRSSIETLASLLGSEENKTTYFNMANRFTGDRPVHTAMRFGYLEVLRALVAHGADPTAKNRFGDTVLDYPGDYEMDEAKSIVDEYRAKSP